MPLENWSRDDTQSAICHAAEVGQVVAVWIEAVGSPSPAYELKWFSESPIYSPHGEGWYWIDGWSTEKAEHPFGPIGGTVEVASGVYQQHPMSSKPRHYKIQFKLLSVTPTQRGDAWGWEAEMERMEG